MITIAVGPSSGALPVQEVTSFGSVSIALDVESGSNLQFVCRADSPEAAYIDELATDVWVMGDVNLRFRTWAVWQEWYLNGQDNVSTMAVTYKKLLNRRLVHDGLLFTDTDLGDIMWGLWTHTQALPGGNLGVTKGTPTTTGMIRTREYKSGENLGTMADNEDEEGLWWQIDQDLKFTAGSLATRPFVGAPLHLGATVREMQRASGSDFANAVYGDADSTTTPVWATAANVATDPRGRWERAQGWPTVSLQETLDERTAAFLADASVSVAHWNVELEPARWLTDCKIMPGDHCVLVVPRTLAAPVGIPTPKIVVQVTSIQLGIDADGGFDVKAVVMEQPNVSLPT